MEYKIGHKIRYFRDKSKMTQEELCRGIISVSYLSKIERGVVDAPEEVINLLNKRLEINPSIKESEDISLLSQRWFECLLVGDKEKARDFYEEIEGNMDSIANPQLVNLVEIHKLRYYILVTDIERAKEQYFYLKKAAKNFSDNEIYYWLKFAGNFNYYQLSYKEALRLFLEAENHLSNSIDQHQEKKYDLFYVISIAGSKIRNTHLALVYGSQALEYYRSIYNMKRCAQCHIVLGISYQRSKEANKSLENYQLASIIAENLNDYRVMALCNQNIGKIYSLRKNHEKAIEFYQKSYELRHEQLPVNKIVPISSLMKEYYKLGDLENTKIWLNKGLELSCSLSPEESIYVYEFRVFSQLIYDSSVALIDLITLEILPFLEKKQLLFEKAFYLKILADHYFSTRKYKLAASYYQLANQVFTGNYEE
ncbi:helix-turn-helix transcriptional regulator [Radiobacillus kanasensis]|uniref:helix-turn-helix transcriptional regulator n=1 Tax=Radiobacillus kanasensis TaxID=2844358 RepID=UPI001E4002B7|nr:helix-turn-helix transcriptional regulator [Radiobacillus kanasensis]UFT99139.1 helix-turn-helix transcriptional regulator [Radiobacillus kanasensis]